MNKMQIQVVINNHESKIKSLEASNCILRSALIDLFNGGWDYEHAKMISDQVKTALELNPEQSLNSIKADAISGFISDVANMDVKGSKGTNHAEYYKAALRNVFQAGTYTINKLKAI
tara:strand:+ start:316 stop:666 length:351 start_codon:yes stop_codon:yes gene_type:complete